MDASSTSLRTALLALVASTLFIASTSRARGQDHVFSDTSAPGFLATDEAFRYVRARVNDAERIRTPTGNHAVEADAPQPPDIALHGACVTLRLDGQVIGRGEALGAVRALDEAATRAIAQAREHLPAAVDAVQRAARAKLWSRVIVSLELAGPLTRVRPRTFSDLDKDILAGLEGVAVREGDATELRFPSQMLASNDSPAAACVSMISTLTGSPTLAIPGVKEQEAGALGETRGIGYYKFRVTHMAQSSASAPAMLLTRGGRIVPQQEVNAQSLRDMARRVSEHLLARRTEVAGSTELFADIWPLQGRRGDLAGTREKALVALALCEAARLDANPGTPLPRQVSFAQELLVPMLSVEGRLRDLSPATSAALLIAVHELLSWTGSPRGQWWPARRDQLASALRACVKEDGTWSADVREGERAMVVLGLALLGTSDILGAPNENDARLARNATATLMRDTPPTQIVTHMPWLGRAMLVLSGEGEITGASVLRQMRERVNTIRLSRASALALGMDVEGGLLFAGETYPSIHGARPVTFLATMLADPRFTDAHERLPELSRLLESLRFLRQLTVDEWWAWIVPDDAPGMWGVRASPMDQRQSAEGNALVLLACAESVRSIDRLSQQMRAGNVPER